MIQWLGDTVHISSQIEKLEPWHWGFVTDCQRVTWIAFAILAMFFLRITSVSKSNWEMVSRVSQRQQLWTLSNGICSFTAEHSFLWNISLLKKTEQGIDWWHYFGILYFPSCSSPALDPGILRRDHHQSCRPLIGDLSSISDNLSVLSKFWCSKPAGVYCMWISVVIRAHFDGNSLIKGTDRFCYSRTKKNNQHEKLLFPGYCSYYMNKCKRLYHFKISSKPSNWLLSKAQW